MKITPSNKNLQYTGRIDWSKKEAPIFIFPCTSVAMRFTTKTLKNSKLKIYVENKAIYWDSYVGCILDGVQTSHMIGKEGKTVIELEVSHETDVHDILLFKRQDSCHELTFLGFELEEGASLIEMPEKPKRKIEVYGDSVSAGEVSEAVDFVGKVDPEHNGEYSNSYYSYAWMTARKLNAQIHNIAQGGIALLDNTGWFHKPNQVGMEQAWDKVHYNPQYGPLTSWDFSNYEPDVVIVAIGQNDNHPEDYMKEDYNGEKAKNWRKGYEAFLTKLRNVYKNAYVVCITTILQHDKNWDKAICQVVEEMKDEKISKYTFKRNGSGTPGHLRIGEAEEMAEELSTYISQLHIEGWE